MAKLLFGEIKKITTRTKFSFEEKNERLFHLLKAVFIEVTRDEKLHFTTLFSRIAYACNKYKVSKGTQFLLHRFRKLMLNGKNDKHSAKEIHALGLKAMAKTVSELFDESIPATLQAILPTELPFSFRKTEIRDFRPSVRVVVLEDNPYLDRLVAIAEDNPEQTIEIQYNIAERNINFNPTILDIRRSFSFPLTVNLLDVEIDKEGIFRPRAFVVEPDYMVDVSAVAECFNESGTEPYLYLLKKFLPYEKTKYLMIGNIANYFLDKLMHDADAGFETVFPEVFKLNPLVFSSFDDDVIRDIYRTTRFHFNRLKKVVKRDMERQKIIPSGCFLEPSFYSNQLGLQGRLDVFYPDGQNTAIIELKSGKPFRPNAYGINHNHFTQTLLYDLIIKSVFGKETTSANYILYSGVDEKQLRFAPVIKAQQYEAIQVRNQLVAIEKRLASFHTSATEQQLNAVIPDLSKLRPEAFPRLKGFSQKDLIHFAGCYGELTELEKKYFNAFTGFIAREHELAKTGTKEVENVNGLASLWLNTTTEKEENYEIISRLKIRENHVKDTEPVIIFEKTDKTNPLANFRTGDIAVLYPLNGSDQPVLSNQVFKCSILEISEKEVKVRLRFSQFNDSIFRENDFWNIEHDMFDSGFISQYRALFAFGKHKNEKRELLLTTRPPEKPEKQMVQPPKYLTSEQQKLFKEIVTAKDYYLLWGPPGTGKTSKMLKAVVEWLYQNTEENLLLLAYTNRAVDEICDAVEGIFPEGTDRKYLRIGSPYSTAKRFEPFLLSKKMEGVKTRKELREIIAGHRIVVGTLASVANKTTLFHLKNFDRAIIDEASQILEPQLVGMLPKVSRFVLIGDHKQLPAVVRQTPQMSAVNDDDLREIGLDNMRNSLFERMYKRCTDMNWDWAFGTLSHQGRMHREIMEFPNRHFYNGFLKILPDEIPHAKLQLAPIKGIIPENATELEKMLMKKRMIYIPTKTDDDSANNKTNRHEAEKISELVKAFQRLYKANGKKLTKDSIGIITPFRAQIAQITEVLKNNQIDTSLLTIDTVERYQGSAREVILISFCTNNSGQFTTLTSVSEEGIDRKLNVAITRAKDHLIFLGNEEILGLSEIYRQLINLFRKV